MMAPRILRGPDVSEWTAPVAAPWWASMVQQYGTEGAAVQAWGSGHVPGRRNEYIAPLLRGARMAGHECAVYIWPPADWQEALLWCQRQGVWEMFDVVYLDVEAGAPVLPEHVIGVRETGKEPAIYTSPNAWATIMGNTTLFADLKLWLARYPWAAPPGELYGIRWREAEETVAGHGSLGKAALASFRVGGWDANDVVMWQFAGTTAFLGETADQNLALPSAFRRGDSMETFTNEDRDLLKQIRWHQAVGQLVAADAAVLEGAAEHLRSGKKFSLQMIDALAAVLERHRG